MSCYLCLMYLLQWMRKWFMVLYAWQVSQLAGRCVSLVEFSHSLARVVSSFLLVRYEVSQSSMLFLNLFCMLAAAHWSCHCCQSSSFPMVRQDISIQSISSYSSRLDAPFTRLSAWSLPWMLQWPITQIRIICLGDMYSLIMLLPWISNIVALQVQIAWKAESESWKWLHCLEEIVLPGQLLLLLPIARLWRQVYG